MGADSKIEWCHHTFNSWWGCHKIDPECKNCYAATFSKRTGHDVWGVDSPRRFFGAKHWLEPIKWNRAAVLAGERKRVFCSSMADVFEDRRDLDVWRSWLWALIAQTPNLDWMLLTKRPECMIRLAPREWRHFWPKNVWAGTTGGCQETVDDNVPELLRVPADIHFLSAEPLLGPIDIRRYLRWTLHTRDGRQLQHPDPEIPHTGGYWSRGLSLVITGAESGHNARMMDEQWVRSLCGQCDETGTPFFYKQKVEEKNRVVSLPLLDGKQWTQMPEARP